MVIYPICLILWEEEGEQHHHENRRGIVSSIAPQNKTHTNTQNDLFFRLVRLQSRTIATTHSAGVHLHSLLTLRAWQQTSNSKCCKHMHAPSHILIPLSKNLLTSPRKARCSHAFWITVARKPNHLKQPSAK